MNTDKVNNVSIVNRSDIGLIGKLGENVTSNVGAVSKSGAGDTGVLNLSYIYSQIRTPFCSDHYREERPA